MLHALLDRIDRDREKREMRKGRVVKGRKRLESE